LTYMIIAKIDLASKWKTSSELAYAIKVRAEHGTRHVRILMAAHTDDKRKCICQILGSYK